MNLKDATSDELQAARTMATALTEKVERFVNSLDDERHLDREVILDAVEEGLSLRVVAELSDIHPSKLTPALKNFVLARLVEGGE